MTTCYYNGKLKFLKKKKLQKLLPPGITYEKDSLQLLTTHDIPIYSILYHFIHTDYEHYSEIIIPIEMQAFQQAMDANCYIMRSNMGFYLVTSKHLVKGEKITIFPPKYIKFCINSHVDENKL